MTPPSHLSDCLLLICQCVSLSLFIVCVVGIASSFPSLLHGAKRALENYSVRILVSLVVTIALCFFWDGLCSLSNYLFYLIGGHRATLFFLSLLVCFVLCWMDLQKKKGLRLTWLSLLPLFLFAVEWARLEGYYLVAVAAICFFCVLFALSLLNSAFYPSHPAVKGDRKPVLLGRRYMYDRLISNTLNMMEAGECKAVAILGRWGEGKTHLLNDIIYRLSHERFLSNKDPKGTRHSVFRVCKINIWQYKTQEEAWEGVTDNIMLAVMGDDYKIRRTLFKLFYKLFPVADFGRSSQFASFLNILYNTTYGLGEEGTNSEISLGVLNNELKGQKLVLVFDDVERADISIVRFLLPLIERLKKIRNLFIICSIAPDELERTFVRNGYAPGEAHDYLIKISDFFYRLPKASRHTLTEMRRKLLEGKEARKRKQRMMETWEKEMARERNGNFIL